LKDLLSRLKLVAYPNNETGIQALVQRLLEVVPELVVLEATGKLHLDVATAIAKTEIKVAVINPRQVRDFARAAGKLAKTDALWIRDGFSDGTKMDI